MGYESMDMGRGCGFCGLVTHDPQNCPDMVVPDIDQWVIWHGATAEGNIVLRLEAHGQAATYLEAEPVWLEARLGKGGDLIWRSIRDAGPWRLSDLRLEADDFCESI